MRTTYGIAALVLTATLTGCDGDLSKQEKVVIESNLKVIQQALYVYALAKSSRQAYPPKIDYLLADHSIHPSNLIVPGTADTPDTKLGPEAATRWAVKNMGYVYLAAGRTAKDPPETILLYTRFDLGLPETAVLFRDGTVRWLANDRARKMLNP